MTDPIRVTVWNEFIHERKHEQIKAIYPDGMHAVIAAGLNAAGGIEARTATLDQPEHGLTEEVLAHTDVLTWWGHCAHGKVADEIVDRVQKHVLDGMGLVVLHSGHFSKIFKRLMGTHCSLKWREAGERERLWNLQPGHPITEGIGPYIEIANTEMYGERFEIPEPDLLIFISWFEGGEVFRSGCCYQRGHGRIFYFRPGHESYPVYHHPDVIKVIVNATRWARRRNAVSVPGCQRMDPLETLSAKEGHFAEAGLEQDK